MDRLCRKRSRDDIAEDDSCMLGGDFLLNSSRRGSSICLPELVMDSQTVSNGLNSHHDHRKLPDARNEFTAETYYPSGGNSPFPSTFNAYPTFSSSLNNRFSRFQSPQPDATSLSMGSGTVSHDFENRSCQGGTAPVSLTIGLRCPQGDLSAHSLPPLIQETHLEEPHSRIQEHPLAQYQTLTTAKRLSSEDRLISDQAGSNFLEKLAEKFLCMQAEEKKLMEEKFVQQQAVLISALEKNMQSKLIAAVLEIEKHKRRALDMEEHVKALSRELVTSYSRMQLSEQTSAALIEKLEQTQAALSREQNKEGCGDSQVDDSQSSFTDNLEHAHARACQENARLREQKLCRVCQFHDASILILPCRHLCLCKECDARMDACPLCRTAKQASVHVNL